VIQGQCGRARSKPLACSSLGTCWWVTTGAADIWEIAIVLDAEEDSYNLLTVASCKSILVPSPTPPPQPPQCFARIDQVLVASSNRTNSQIYMVIIRRSYHCTTAAALAFVEGPELLGGVIYFGRSWSWTTSSSPWKQKDSCDSVYVCAIG
jgi:hypothetical protein